MKERGFFERSGVPSQKAFEHALRLRGAIRDYLKCNPEERRRKTATIESLNKAMEPFPLRVVGLGKDGMKLLAAEANAPAGPSAIVAELYNGALNGTLDRLKMCAADECQRVFFDRSKPGSRRWCQTELCGNREKTRAYRERQKKDAESED
jgi:predicted RNA-binding Zn ribbon-like protein